jgi:hypothetical protein
MRPIFLTTGLKNLSGLELRKSYFYQRKGEIKMTTEQHDVNIEQEESQKDERPRLDAFYWAAALIWIGLIFWADSQGWQPQIGESSAWTWIFLGGGVAGLALNFFSYSSPQYATPTGGDWFWSGLLLVLGLGGFITFNIPWPLVLAVVGVVFLVNAWMRHHAPGFWSG